MTMKLLLVSPKSYALTYDGFSDRIRSILKHSGNLLTANLATVAALTPPEIEVKIIDENVEPIDFDESCDLVGITSFPSQLYRAEEIAKGFSERGVPVVCGGPSVSLNPSRWRSFSDYLIIGEAERIWPCFVQDYLEGAAKPEYRETERFDLDITPIPDYGGYSKRSLKGYSVGIVQTSRGCPFNCEFCDAIAYSGRKVRYKLLETILPEIDQLIGMGLGNHILLSDDNFYASPEQSKTILRALRDLPRRHPVSYHTQLTINASADDEFLRLAAEAGLLRVFIGIETPCAESLEEAGKRPNIGIDLLEAVRRFHSHGIQIISGCISGFDHDDITIFRRQLEFFTEAGITVVRVAPLEALDGTPLKERLVKEGRYIDWEAKGRLDPKRANELNTLTIVPKQMSVEQLEQGIHWLLRQLYDPDRFAERFAGFFSQYEGATPKVADIPRSHFGPREGLFLLRLLRLLLTIPTSVEKRAFRSMLSVARRATHPRRFSILIENFLELLSTRRKIDEVYGPRDIVRYPA